MPNPYPFDYAHCTALITGASRGIGAAVAIEIARRGAVAVILVARNESDLDTLADQIRTRFSTRVEVIVADLSEAAAPFAIKVETDRLGLEVDLLVNNAGFGDYGYFDARPFPKQEHMIGVNVTSLAALTHIYLPKMVSNGRGGILNVASTASFQPVPFMATYGASKAFVLSFSEALWAENHVRGNDVRIVCLCPGGTNTDFGAVAVDGSAQGRGQFENAPQSTPEEVARAGLNALDENASYVVPGALNYFGTFGARLAPRSAVARLAARMFQPQDTQPRAPQLSRESLLRAALTAAAISAGVAGVVMYIRRDRG